MSQTHSLYKSVTFATSSHWVPMKVDKFKRPKGLKYLLDVGFREIEMQRANIKPRSTMINRKK